MSATTTTTGAEAAAQATEEYDDNTRRRVIAAVARARRRAKAARGVNSRVSQREMREVLHDLGIAASVVRRIVRRAHRTLPVEELRQWERELLRQQSNLNHVIPGVRLDFAENESASTVYYCSLCHYDISGVVGRVDLCRGCKRSGRDC